MALFLDRLYLFGCRICVDSDIGRQGRNRGCIASGCDSGYSRVGLYDADPDGRSVFVFPFRYHADAVSESVHKNGDSVCTVSCGRYFDPYDAVDLVTERKQTGCGELRDIIIFQEVRV